MNPQEENREDTRVDPHTETLSGRAYIEELHKTFGKILKPRNKGEVSPKGILKRSN